MQPKEAFESRIKKRIKTWYEAMDTPYRRFFSKIIRRTFLRRLISYVWRNIIMFGFVRQYLMSRIQRLGIFINHYEPEDFSETVLFTDRQDIFPNYPLRSPLSGPSRREPVKVTLISTLRNEKRNAPIWLKNILSQTRLPDEIILVDAGSTDGTQEILEAAALASAVPLRVISEPGANIARGRNIAIKAASNPVIVATDFGCRPKPDWLEKIVTPFEYDPAIQVSGGFYEGILENGKVIQRSAWPTLSQVDPHNFIPSSRSIAFTRAAWEATHGYPEWLTLTGEDTYFGFELKRYCSRWAFVPDAVVQWEVPYAPLPYFKKMRMWCFGDGEAGMKGYLFWVKFARVMRLLLLGFAGILLLTIFGLLHLWWGIMLIALGGVSFLAYYSAKHPNKPLQNWPFDLACECSQIIGFIEGATHRKQADIRRFSQARGLVLILAGVPIEDTGGGSRGTQIAQEYFRNNYVVVYVNRFGSYESVNLGIHIAHPNLLLFHYKDFNVDAFFGQYGEVFRTKPKLALVEFPLPEYSALAASLQKHGAKIAYDLLDDWDSSLGAEWYNHAVEQQLVDSSDALIATAPSLASRLETMSSKPVHLLPNAVNLRLFDSRRAYTKPSEIPESALVITYIGALWGNWFDWDLLVDIALAFPQAALVIIGDYRGQCPQKLPNMHFLGLKPQQVLPRYLAYTNVAIIPWKVNNITLSTSPIKLYEYLAMGVPVVAPDLPLLYQIPFVYTACDRDDFIRKILVASSSPAKGAEMERFNWENSWQNRIDQISQAIFS